MIRRQSVGCTERDDGEQCDNQNNRRYLHLKERKEKTKLLDTQQYIYGYGLKP